MISAVPPGFLILKKDRTLFARNVCPRHRLPRIRASPVLLRREDSSLVAAHAAPNIPILKEALSRQLLLSVSSVYDYYAPSMHFLYVFCYLSTAAWKLQAEF